MILKDDINHDLENATNIKNKNKHASKIKDRLMKMNRK